ncbi:hypothetical protein CcrRB23_gp384 [Caulobacter phage RB23]|nr:hypothetical protein CcrRB23_gp384 [Caulobacter phage RB23]
MLETSPLWEAIALWEEITGVAVPGEDNRFKGSWGNYEVHKTYEELRDTLELDPSEVTTNLMFNIFVKEWLGKQKFDLLSLTNDPQSFLDKTIKPRKLLDILNREEIIEARDEFLETLQATAVKYGADQREDLQKTLGQHDLVAILRRDALKAVNRLRVHQFTAGDSEAADYKPVYVKTVHQWWNINSLLDAALKMPSGVSLNLIKDPDVYQSFYCFCIRNGGNLFILTDAPEHAHPLHGLFTRKPERAYEQRVYQAWFPYDLLGLEWDEEAEQYYQKASEVTALTAYQNQQLPLKPFNELPPAEFLWCSMMLDLIVEKFWRQNYQAKALSYTGEMLVIENRLEAAASSANLPVVNYERLNLPALSLADMRSDVLGAEAIGKGYHQPNKWLEDRFIDKVPETVLNLVANADRMLLLDRKTGQIETQSREFVKKYKAIPKIFDRDRDQMLAGRAQMEVLNPTRFGTREELDNDRKFIARYNFASEIQRLAKEEFEDRKDDIKSWWKTRLRKNLPNLLAYAGCKVLWAEADMQGSNDSFDMLRSGGGRGIHLDTHAAASLGADKTGRIRKVLHTFADRHDIQAFSYETAGFSSTNLGGYDQRRGYLCAVNDTKASYMQTFHPANAEELALLAGIDIKDLPDVLQHWTLADPYDGNHILSRIDPLNWRVSNPWLKLNFQVVLPLSMRAEAKLVARKPPLTYLWPDDKISDTGRPFL